MSYPLAHLGGFPHLHPHQRFPLHWELLPSLVLGLILAILVYGGWKWFRKK